MENFSLWCIQCKTPVLERPVKCNWTEHTQLEPLSIDYIVRARRCECGQLVEWMGLDIYHCTLTTTTVIRDCAHKWRQSGKIEMPRV